MTNKNHFHPFVMEKFSLSLPNPKPHSLPQMHTSNTELFNNLANNSMEYFNTTANGPFSGEGFFDPNHQSQLPMANYYNDGITPVNPLTNYIQATYGRNNPTTMMNPAIMVSSSRGNGIGLPNKNISGKKRKRSNDRDMEKPREVVHVRAKRGQATDSHSLAERLRREKINEKLRCLQDLVPGCYKTMGMAVMLDVIITYVRSLQNQIDFLSMKLSAASLYYDFNSTEAEAIETLQGTTGYEAAGMEKVGEGYINNGGISQFQTSTWAPL